MDAVLGIVGGSGLYDLPGLQGAEWRNIEAPGASRRTKFSMPSWMG
jgi:purine nucleoside phosphorylase